jgi:hypothetical protein
MPEDKSGIKGIIKYELFDKDGKLKQKGQTVNVVTTQGNNYYVDQLSDAGGSVAQIFVLGTGTTAVGTTDTWVDGYFSDNGTTAGTAGAVGIVTNTGTANSLQYAGTFSAGYATQDGITRVGLTNTVASADGNGTPNNSTTFFIAHGTIDPTVNKGANDSLIVTWDHLFEGS